MIIPNRITTATAKRFDRLPPRVRKRGTLDFIPSVKRDLQPAHLAQRSGFFDLGGSRPSPREYERMMGSNDLVDEFYLMRALLVAQPVARLSIRAASDHERGPATGFMVSPRLLLTNHHVFPRPADAEFSIAEFNFRDDLAGNPEPSFRYRLRPNNFFFACEPLDFALVAVEAQPMQDGPPLSRWGWLRLIAESGKARVKEWLTIIQHPGGQRRQFAIRENQCVDDSNENFLWYMSDTAPGSSGAPVFNDSFQVAALHHSGRAKKKGEKYLLRNGQLVDSIQDVDDSLVEWIANEGIRISRICAVIESEAKEQDGHLAELRSAMQDGDILSRAFQNPQANETMSMPMNIPATVASGTVVPVTLDLRLTLYGRPLAPSGAATDTSRAGNGVNALGTENGAVEAYKEPIVDTNYSNRKGFKEKFLGPKTPFPTLTNPSLAAPMIGSTKVKIPYENFTVVMHKTRRLAIYTAANVDWNKAARKPEPNRPDSDYNREALGGFIKDKDTEKWLLDKRLAAEHQVPDKFYKDDKQSFDKGHIVRRDDMCWGSTYALLQRANGDTYHVTNCSPQVEKFNQAKWQGLWGLLENMIQAQGKTEKYNIFAGPVLADGDRFFNGKSDDGPLRLQIPSAFWKVVTWAENGKLKATGFVLEQDLSNVPPGAEFMPTGQFIHKVISLKKLEQRVKLIRFPKALHNADQNP